MPFTTRAFVPLVLLLTALLAPEATHAQAPANAKGDAGRAWGFDRSDLQPHPGVRFGVLANGMRYAVMGNKVPAGALAVRLRFEAGADVEAKKERGFMHVLEHLVFHGTERIPEGSLPSLLAPHGLRTPFDMNAYTTHDETVYRLDLRKADAPARQAALLVMREVATGLRFSRSAVAAAKNKVRDEIAGRDAVQDRVDAAQNAFFVPGTPLALGPVAGTPASVSRATGAALQRLYRRHYVPSQATLVIVGDVDPDEAEAEIAASFSDWPPAGVIEPEPSPPILSPRRGIEARLFLDRLAPTVVTIASVEPLGPGADAGRRRDNQFLEHLAGQMLNRRLAQLAAATQAPFLKADHAAFDHFSTARLARIELVARDRGWRDALAAGAAELRRALEQGFTQPELEAQLAMTRRALAAAAAPRTSSALADAITDAVHRKIVFTLPADPSASAAYLDRIRLSDLNAAFRSVWRGASPLIFVSSDRPVSGGEAAIAALWAKSMAAPVEAASGALPSSPRSPW